MRVHPTSHANNLTEPVKLIRGGTLVLPHGLMKTDVLIVGERIGALLGPTSPDDHLGLEVDEMIDAKGLLIFPGIIDSHVHFATGTSHCDTLIDVAQAAALGGVTMIIGYIWAPQGDILAEIKRQQDAVQNCPIDVGFHVILTPEQTPEEIIPPIMREGITSFKFFMAYQQRRLGMDDTALFQALRIVARNGALALIHAEHGGIISALEAELAAAGHTAITDYPLSRPAGTEVEAISRSLWLAELANCPLYIVHVSTAKGLDAIVRERARHRLTPDTRPPVYAETCPKYVLLNQKSYETLGNKAKVAPPLRSERDREHLFRALLSSNVDTLASDHAPYSFKLKAGASFLDVQTGAPGVQTLFPIILSRLLQEQARLGESLDSAAGRYGAALDALQRTLSLRPAQIFGLYPRKGWIGPGADADLVFVDPFEKWKITGDWLVSNSGFSLYQDWYLQGKPIHSLVRGRWVMRNGQLVGSYQGQYFARS